jgi:hypothetical protein
MVDAVIMFIIFSPALAFFAGRTFIKYKALQLHAGAVSPQVMRRIDALERDNDELRRRVETLETIATGLDAPRGADAAFRLKMLEQQMQQTALQRLR